MWHECSSALLIMFVCCVLAFYSKVSTVYSVDVRVFFNHAVCYKDVFLYEVIVYFFRYDHVEIL